MELSSFILLIALVSLAAALIIIVKPFLSVHGTHLNITKTRRDDNSFYHRISFSHTTTNAQEAAELTKKISSLISRTTAKYNQYNPSQLEEEIKSTNIQQLKKVQ